jgi:hypothetical protein
MKFDLLGDIGVDDGATSPAREDTQSPLKKSRRTTKRKTKGSPAFEDDDDDDNGARLKRRRYTKKTKATMKKTKDSAEDSYAPSPKSKKSKTPLTIPTLREEARNKAAWWRRRGNSGVNIKEETTPARSGNQQVESQD